MYKEEEGVEEWKRKGRRRENKEGEWREVEGEDEMGGRRRVKENGC